MSPAVIEDALDTTVSFPTPEESFKLNAQTAYNRSAIEGNPSCRCFHCGSSFSGDDIVDWLSEADGEDTALCPCCGVDAVISSTTEHSLSTALLAALYIKWFPDEYAENCANATCAPSFSSIDDYWRKGVPFLLCRLPHTRIVGEITLFPERIMSDQWDDLNETESFVSAMATIREESPGGVVKARAYFDDDGYYHSDFIDEFGNLLPFSPWTGTQQDLLLELSALYGEALHGIISQPGGRKMQLFVIDEI